MIFGIKNKKVSAWEEDVKSGIQLIVFFLEILPAWVKERRNKKD